MPIETNEHGGNFVALVSVIKMFGKFRVNSRHPGCHDFGKFVVENGYLRYSIPGVSYDISKKDVYLGLVKGYCKNGWMRETF